MLGLAMMLFAAVFCIVACADGICEQGSCVGDLVSNTDEEASAMKASLLQIAREQRGDASKWDMNGEMNASVDVAADVTIQNSHGEKVCWKKYGKSGQLKRLYASSTNCDRGYPGFIYNSKDKSFRNFQTHVRNCVQVSEGGLVVPPGTSPASEPWNEGASCTGAPEQQFEFECDLQDSHACKGTIKSVKEGTCVEMPKTPEGASFNPNATAPSLKPCDPGNPMQLWVMQDQLYSAEVNALVHAVKAVTTGTSPLLLSNSYYSSHEMDRSYVNRRLKLEPDSSATLVQMRKDSNPLGEFCRMDSPVKLNFSVQGETVKLEWPDSFKHPYPTEVKLRARPPADQTWTQSKDQTDADEPNLGLQLPAEAECKHDSPR